ncbi:MAG: SpoIIE family protein phosphatase [Bryobacteraceae bacterium]
MGRDDRHDSPLGSTNRIGQTRRCDTPHSVAAVPPPGWRGHGSYGLGHPLGADDRGRLLSDGRNCLADLKRAFDAYDHAIRTRLLRQGDLLAVFSDGIPEAENAAALEFGEARLGELLAKHAGEPLENIVQIVTEGVRAWIHDSEGRDDTTLVLLRKR